MHFLCLHGMGTNSRIFKSQTSAIRHALGPDHTYEWLDGSHPTQMAPNIGDFVSTNEEFLEYADQSSPESCIQALLALDSFIEEEGPFDAVMAFSQGAALASSLMIYRLRKDPERESASPTFRCAVFFSGGPPEDPSNITSGSRRVMNYQADGEIIGIPTVHIWGKYDQLYPTFGPVLSKLCKASYREEFIHDGGHEIPGPRDQVAVARTVQLIKRAIGRTVKA